MLFGCVKCVFVFWGNYLFMKRVPYSYSTFPSVYALARKKSKRNNTSISKLLHGYLLDYVAEESEVSGGSFEPEPVDPATGEGDPDPSAEVVDGNSELSTDNELSIAIAELEPEKGDALRIDNATHELPQDDKNTTAEDSPELSAESVAANLEQVQQQYPATSETMPRPKRKAAPLKKVIPKKKVSTKARKAALSTRSHMKTRVGKSKQMVKPEKKKSR